MKLDFSNDRILAVVAHPDDAEYLCAGTLARAKDEGAVVAICVMCKGDKGQPGRQIKNLAAVRRREMAAAAKLLGATLYWAGFSDAALDDDRPARLKLVEVYRRFRPTLILAHSPDDYHPDHCAASAIAQAASWLCASKGNKTRSPALAVSPAVWFMDTINMNRFEPGFFIDIENYAEVKTRMLACHRSQMQRSSDKDLGCIEHGMHLQSQTRGLQAGVEAAEAFCIYRAFKRIGAW